MQDGDLEVDSVEILVEVEVHVDIEMAGSSGGSDGQCLLVVEQFAGLWMD